MREVIFSPTGSRRKTNRPVEKVDVLVVHFSGTKNPHSAYHTIHNEALERSYHFLIAPDGEWIWCFVPPNQVAWHAGRSLWRGRQHLNNTSVSVSFSKDGTAPYTDGEIAAFTDLLTKPYRFVPDERYPAEGDDLLLFEGSFPCLLNQFPAIRPDHLISHSEIAQAAIEAGLRPKNNPRFDPGPLFPWDRVGEAVAAHRGISSMVVRPNKTFDIPAPVMAMAPEVEAVESEDDRPWWARGPLKRFRA